MFTPPRLPDGDYPFVDERLPLSEMRMVEAPPALHAALLDNARRAGVAIVRDEVVQLNCAGEALDATFVIYWPSGEGPMHMLVPRDKAKGVA